MYENVYYDAIRYRDDELDGMNPEERIFMDSVYGN